MESSTKFVVIRNGAADVAVTADRFESNGKGLRFFAGEENKQIAMFAEGHWSYVLEAEQVVNKRDRAIL